MIAFVSLHIGGNLPDFNENEGAQTPPWVRDSPIDDFEDPNPENRRGNVEALLWSACHRQWMVRWESDPRADLHCIRTERLFGGLHPRERRDFFLPDGLGTAARSFQPSPLGRGAGYTRWGLSSILTSSSVLVPVEPPGAGRISPFVRRAPWRGPSTAPPTTP